MRWRVPGSTTDNRIDTDWHFRPRKLFQGAMIGTICSDCLVYFQMAATLCSCDRNEEKFQDQGRPAKVQSTSYGRPCAGESCQKCARIR